MKWVAAIAAACLIAAVAFVFRFNTLGGALGGFDNDEFAHLLRSQALLRGEQPLRDFADAELRGAWPSLSYALPAWAQQVWGQSLLAEAYLAAGALAIAYGVLFVTALDLSGRHWFGAVAAAMLAIATFPKLYNYPKVVMLAFGAAAIRFAVHEPSAARLAVAAVVTAVATLFRHDYGVYLSIGMIAGIVARDFGRWRDACRRVAIFGACTAGLLLPSMVWVQVYQGIVPYVANAVRTSGIESERTWLPLPTFDMSGLFGSANLIAFTYYAFWAIPVLALLVVAWRLPGDGERRSPGERGVVFGLIALAVAVNVFFLRSNLPARFGDAVIPVALLAAWMAGALLHGPARPLRTAGAFAPLALLLLLIPCAYVYAELTPELQNSRVTRPAELGRQFDEVRASLAQLPPRQWGDGVVEGKLRVAQYLAECTHPDDRVLMAAYAPEVLVFADRGFAGGQPTVSLAMYVSEAEQQATLARWKRQSVPVVVGTDDFEEEFVTDYPLLARHVAEQYHEAGAIPIGGDAHFRVFVENARAQRTDPRFNLPCFR